MGELFGLLLIGSSLVQGVAKSSSCRQHFLLPAIPESLHEQISLQPLTCLLVHFGLAIALLEQSFEILGKIVNGLVWLLLASQEFS